MGQPVSRVEGVDKVTGNARYSADTRVEGVVYAALVQARIPHGRVTAESLDSAAARAGAARGVLYVLTPTNCPPLQALPRELTWDLPVERRPPLSDLTVQHVGQHLALVVADSPENAMYAASSMDVDYIDAPADLDAGRVVASGDVTDDDAESIRHGAYRPDHFVKLTDEKLQDFRGPSAEPSGVKVDQTYRTAINTHYPIELSATVAHWEDGHLTVHDCTRWITGERRVLAAYLNIPEDHVRVVSPLVGGAFGSKSFLWMHVVLCAVAARELSRPVKLVLTRDQMFSSTGHRPRTEQQVTLVADPAGAVLSTEHHTLTETSTVAHFCEPAGLSTRFLYRSPRLAVTHTVARIHSPTPCFMRGPGRRRDCSLWRRRWTSSPAPSAETRWLCGWTTWPRWIRPTGGRGRARIWPAVTAPGHVGSAGKVDLGNHARCNATVYGSDGGWPQPPTRDAGCPRAAACRPGRTGTSGSLSPPTRSAPGCAP